MKQTGSAFFVFVFIISLWIGVSHSVAANGLQGSWSVGAAAPSKRTEVAVAELNGKIYVVGGFAEPDVSNALDYGISKAVEVYDPMTDSWTTTTPLPEGRHHVGIASLGGYLYVVGGYSQSLFSVWEPVVTVYRYDPATTRWEDLAPMPTARGGLGATTLNGRLYAIGGYNGKENPTAVEVFDPKTNSWTTGAPLPTPRDHLAVISDGSRIYAIGGRKKGNYNQNLAAVEEYDPMTDQWRSRADLPTARSGITAGVLEGRIYVLGGESGSGTFSNNEAYNPKRDQWQPMSPMPTARHGLGSAVVGGKLYVISGGPTPGGSFSDKNEIFSPPHRVLPTSSRGKRAPAAHIGAVMAILATLEDAQVLPPEGTPEADQLIHVLIQLQSAFLKSSDPAVRTYFSEALAAYFFDGASEAERQFQQGGWNSRILEAVLLYEAYPHAWKSPGLDKGLAAYNVNRQSVEILQTTFDQARQVFLRQKRDIHDVYQIRRTQMPG
jgi:N-acetylneuraminic acid mutarotase